MSKEKYSCYEFGIKKIPVGEWKDRYDYIIFSWNDYLCCEDNIESDEWFDTEQEAREAAIQHIDRLENGEG